MHGRFHPQALMFSTLFHGLFGPQALKASGCAVASPLSWVPDGIRDLLILYCAFFYLNCFCSALYGQTVHTLARAHIPSMHTHAHTIVPSMHTHTCKRVHAHALASLHANTYARKACADESNTFKEVNAEKKRNNTFALTQFHTIERATTIV